MSAPPRSELAAAAAALLRLGEERPPAAAMNLLQRKGRPEWRPREEEPRKGTFVQRAPVPPCTPGIDSKTHGPPSASPKMVTPVLPCTPGPLRHSSELPENL
ncbi:hypothetical protein DUI87_35393 [Hirundo rustica rustica]|uniref:NYAP1 kinase n=1 Tax=Hirundo rustica rustica TaxID=333673 RepID=A0A3M0J0T3_HIRRU|nr:hypothetical protein DUI87_35393 [Hirundo rustica rustica]